MHGSQAGRLGVRTRPRALRVAYAVSLGVGALALGHDGSITTAHLLTGAALAAVSIVGYAASCHLRARVKVFDMGLAVALVALVAAGPLVALVVSLAPELVHLARRRRAYWNLGFAANALSFLAALLAGGLVLRDPIGPGRTWHAVAVCLAGIAMLLANYGVARLVPAVLDDGERPGPLVRSEFLRALPVELGAVLLGAACALLLPVIGIPVLALLIALAQVPQLVAARLLSAPSVAALSVDDAATAYRYALADELALSRADRRQVHLIDALVERRPLPEAPPNPLAAIQDALLVTTCTLRPPTQLHFSATPRTQVVLVGRAWAELTARCTPALNHREALVELGRSGLVHDAPLALAAAARIVEREHALTEHVAGVPHLHRAPLPRAIRHELLPVALGRLAA